MVTLPTTLLRVVMTLLRELPMNLQAHPTRLAQVAGQKEVGARMPLRGDLLQGLRKRNAQTLLGWRVQKKGV